MLWYWILVGIVLLAAFGVHIIAKLNDISHELDQVKHKDPNHCKG